MLQRYIRPYLGERVLASMRPMDVQTTFQKMIERGLQCFGFFNTGRREDRRNCPPSHEGLLDWLASRSLIASDEVRLRAATRRLRRTASARNLSGGW